MRTGAVLATVGLMAWNMNANDLFVESTVALRVVDQDGAPIPNANVSVNSYTLSRMLDGVSGTNGVFSYTDRIGGDVTCYVHKEGYYATHGGLWGGPHKWADHPVAEYTVVLKRKIAPAPLLFRRIEDKLVIPSLKKPYAFDFEIGDLVEPYGRGKKGDVWFVAENRVTATMDYDTRVTIAFTNATDGILWFDAPTPEDGVLASDLMPMQVAPVSGYTNSIVVFNSMRPGTPGATSWADNKNYVFRVRSATNDRNEVVSANVGWLKRDIHIGVSDMGLVGLAFSYYYNPDTKSVSLEPLDADNKSRRRR